MIDWVKVRKERRMKLVAVSQEDVEDYILISKLPVAGTVSTFDFPDDWQVGGVSYDPQRRVFVFLILSPDYVPLLLGMMPEEIRADRHIIEITRKVVGVI